MDRKAFYAALRRDKRVFGTSLSQPQVDGIDALLDGFARHRVTDPHHASHILSNVHRETGRIMSPIKETVMMRHRDKNPSDATVISRLERAWKRGRLPWVKTPYWRDGGFGRGQIQLTHFEPNYVKAGVKLGLPLRQQPDMVMQPRVSASIAIRGMLEGWFTGKKLPDYRFPQDLGNAPRDHPRRIVNGSDGSDKEITRHHHAFYDAIKAAGGLLGNLDMGAVEEDLPQPPQDAPAPAPAPKPDPKPAPAAKPEPPKPFISQLLDILSNLFRRN